MIRINLLPYREENRQFRRTQFYSLLAVVAAIAGVIVFLGYLFLAGLVQGQEERNLMLEDGIKTYEAKIIEVEELKKEIQGLVDRKDTIESLQDDRSETVHLLSELVTQVPGGIYLTEVTQRDKAVTLSGLTQSSSRVSTLMKNIENSPWMEAPRLNFIRAQLINNRPLGAFSLEFRLVKEKAPAPEADAAAAGAAPAEGGQQ
jgi:type IV pilus assembly protein PilN